jgi:serine/threonine protein kinase
MLLSVGTKHGPYEILAPIGAGGMGEVYKARDTRLDRIVALKVSKTEFTERFEREAHAIASLNHPNICTLHDVGPNYLVMEYIEGTPLKGPLPVSQALKYAAQICDALDAAHKKGLTHRDLKPANILVTKTGVKLLDFGLAKLSSTERSADARDADTLTMALTSKNEIVGTMYYMSPEQLQSQATGLQIDGRSDIFSFGLVLYEMLTGKRAFEGSSPASVIAAIMERPAPSVAEVAPLALDRVLKTCLAKDPEERWQTVRDLKREMEWIASAAEPTTTAPRKAQADWLPWGVAAAMALCAAALALLHFRETPPAEPASIIFSIPPPEKSSIDYFSLSPDGRLLAFVADGRLWIRPLDSLQAHALPETEGTEEMFWSPDSHFLAFVAQGKLRKIAASGGPAQVLCEVKEAFGGTWNRDGVIVLPLSLSSGFFHVSASGGTPVALSNPNPSGRTSPRGFPEFLPDGRHFLYWGGNGEERGLNIGSLDGAYVKRLLPDVSRANYVLASGTLTSSGYLLFRRGDALMAQGFDSTRLSLSGDASPIAEKIGGDPIRPSFSASENGTLVYAPPAGSGCVQLVWRDRTGKQAGLFGPPGTYGDFRLAPDEKRVVFTTGRDIWVLDSVRGVNTRLTFDPGIDDPAIWSPDGRSIAWASNRSGAFDLYIKSASGVGADRLLTRMGTATGWPEDWSLDGRFLLYQIPGLKTGQDLWIAPQPAGAATDQTPFPYLQSEFDEQHGRFSPDGHWVAYMSNESGINEIYVQSFPASGTKFQISTGGGREPQWRKDGSEIFYIAADRMLMAVPVKLGRPVSESLQVGQAKPLFPLSIVSSFIVSRSYAPSNDGQRFLTPALPGGASAPPLTVILNWQAGLKK